jgi:hypothetical protein
MQAALNIALVAGWSEGSNWACRSFTMNSFYAYAQSLAS